MTDKRPSTTPMQSWVTVGLFIIIAAAALAWEYTKIPKNTTPSLTMNQDSRTKKITQPRIFFYTAIFLQRDHTFLSLPYKFEAQPQPMFLSLTMEKGADPIEFLVDHPLFHLGWQRLETPQVSLYQKEPRYESVAAFLKNPPPANQIAIDPTIQNRPEYKNLRAKPITDNMTGDDCSYVLTAYHPPRTENGWSYFETTVDASKAEVDQNKKMEWYIFAEKASDQNPFYIGEIHIDYR